MASDRHSPQSEVDQMTSGSQSDIDFDAGSQKKSAPTPSANPSPQSKNDSRSNSPEIRRVKELESALLDKEKLVTVLTERLAQVADQLDYSQRISKDAANAENLRLKAMEEIILKELGEELQEKEQLVESLKQGLAEVTDQLEQSQKFINDSADTEDHRIKAMEEELLKELGEELQEKERLVVDLKERLTEVIEQLEQSQRANQELTAAENLRMEELELELQEKEQLVVILTERLEQVAEQLDRRHRTGADRGMTISGGIPQEVIEEQQKLSQDLHSVLEQFQGTDTKDSLSRIELQIAELKQLVESGYTKDSSEPKSSSLVDYLASPSIPAIEEVPLSQPEESASIEESSTSTPMNAETTTGWEAMKEKLLSGQGVNIAADLAKHNPAPPPPVPAQQSSVQTFAAEQTDTCGRTISSYKPPLPDAPADVDYAQASQNQLVEAICERDQYISLLIKRVREAEMAIIPVNWEQLNNVPEELSEKIQSLHNDLVHNLGMAEVEISIERAQLSRTESMLQNREEQIRKKEKQLGLNLERSEESVAEANEIDEDRKKSWLGFLN
ncbi:MAG: hypothetical protein QM501_01670 [Gimesia sp.]